ncbi:Uncharacterized protein HZ326_14779 [Fusarium oxysporum f. sp. albedinis]|nr:Uncharacterized protein HZ326_14779 [Fusarium oxysporum f. sp. albedinis]
MHGARMGTNARVDGPRSSNWLCLSRGSHPRSTVPLNHYQLVVGEKRSISLRHPLLEITGTCTHWVIQQY